MAASKITKAINVLAFIEMQSGSILIKAPESKYKKIGYK